MQRFTETTHRSVAWIKKASDDGRLEMKPPFQRNPVWSIKQQGALIETMLLEYPIPEIYMQDLVTQLGDERHIVVDGQQRIRAVLDYIGSTFEIDEEGSRWTGMSFEELAPEDKKKIYEYKFVTRVLPEMADDQIRSIFQRINRNTVVLNAQAKPDADSLHLSLDGFEGPLDLLLELARRQRVNLTKISVPMLVDQYLLAVSDLEGADLIQRADWLVMMAWLTWLKSRLLLPTDPDEAREAAQAEQMLTQRLVELAEVRTVADWLNGQPQLGWDTFERGRAGMGKVVMPGADFVMLLEACLSILRVAEKRPAQVYQPRKILEWSPHQAMTRILGILEKHPQGGDLLGFVPRLPEKLPNRMGSVRAAIASTLIAGLEMARNAQVTLRQRAPFAPIMVEAAPAGAKNELELNRTGEPAV